ncbi:hypothetical protein TheveDRAFT_0638 [Thermanaerovibrio velox DSM 12556]|uniref:Epoxyqueuosine reductase QueH n=1 Tax=Thermanaerovibrio velox DSM 12556 TaxID=926567 RepID=H0UQW8_9BACT|nr:epoxyqueuosine reductase QueH [Thermanaerovibrio velox]EHM09797.1 hypothetical protein TheveDRAFT_0638 [Thermanaerovibrio velox DSM 12556]
MSDWSSKPKLLLHICCAPDGTVPWEELRGRFHVTGYFYGSNVHPEEEYLKRLQAVMTLKEHMAGDLITEPYDPEGWMRRTWALREEAEGGGRCGLCFAVQLMECARRAVEGGFEWICTTLTISPHKDPVRINAIGRSLAKMNGLMWEERVWRKGGGFVRSVEMSRRMGLYRQTWCGCLWAR